MQIIKASAVLISPGTYESGLQDLQKIEAMARISHRAEDKQTDDSWYRFLTAVILQHGDWSVAEHASATVLFRVNRGITHETVRHRLFGFTQESTRFVNYSRKEHEPEYIPSVGVKIEDVDEWAKDLSVADQAYQKWLSRGYAPQIARDHLPNALASSISMTGNFRSWRHFFLMRTTQESHPDMRDVAIPLLKIFQERIPLLYQDIEPNARQIENLRKAK